MERKGKCNNVGVCSRAGQIFTIKDDEEFKCPECDEPLEEVKEETSDGGQKDLRSERQKKTLTGIIAVLLGLAAIIGGIIAFSGGGSEEPGEQVAVADSVATKDSLGVEAQVVKDTVVVTDTIMHTDTVVQRDTVTVEVAAKPVTTAAPVPHKTAAPKQAASGSKNLGYATFKGSWPNDVNGRMVFKSAHVIDSRDPKGRMAEAGDYVIGEWADGHLVQGIWYGADNQVKGSVIIGR